MLNIEELKQKACSTIDKRKKDLINIAKDVLANPEAGFRETRTASLVAKEFDQLGIPHNDGLAITGVKGRIAGGAGPGGACRNHAAHGFALGPYPASAGAGQQTCCARGDGSGRIRDSAGQRA